ncbi:phosphodiester glycosidase family protein [Nocardioides euryhalodurans]|uniref:Phosphodiester glycosidase family protein n=1 Tax=Nocardioides euryhalodurans TaxID=2518370 RepID=A0A4P7GJY8_9ACTN|nr:phosphodiester glycosidase family protein [Nocardioides euryhalodurans]QBR92233.1 phosphodiester glycosidase family protein [Nocardioides euryhalodurans]
MLSRIGLACVALGLTAVSLAILPDDPGPDPSGDRGSLSGRSGDQPRQTSDGLPGEIARDLRPGVSTRPRVSGVRERTLAPGVSYRRWDRTDRRGRFRSYLVTVDLAKKGVRLDYATGSTVASRGALTALLRRDEGVVAGINGGFFDIDDTGAPLGVGRDRERGFLHAAKYTWKNTFTIARDGTTRIGPVTMQASIAERPMLEITNVNSPRVREGRVGIYTRAWGRTSGYSVTDGQRRNVRMVVVRDGVVVSRSTRLPRDRRIRGTVLIGRGPGAEQLARLRVGAPATVAWGIPESYDVALGGESVLLRQGRVRVSDDVYLHPRTAIGIDRDTGRILLLVVDGRQDHSRGLTMVELARLMRRLGAETALNLDGGGSSTLAGLTGAGRLRVLSSPSDGAQRPIPDGLAVLVG